jgi:hypothetical protein
MNRHARAAFENQPTSPAKTIHLETIMKIIYTIGDDNNINAFAELPADTVRAEAFASEHELAKLSAHWPASRLLDIWNSFAGVAPFDKLKPAKKFTDRKSALSRIWKAVQRLPPAAAPQAPTVATVELESKKSPRATAERAAPRDGANNRRCLPCFDGRMAQASMRS